ncbi:MAG TPA: adenosylcobalamin-dependent ribonucleoside-diphosphate reductase [Candidatus Nanoarchaeia archaeon]|nr:adenosylcobalamin-dependent ribonucleoside-diphosphate reductase [Candidatus Nanoarchaeia archaeon]
MIKKVKKRDGRVVDFDRTKIEQAIMRAAAAVGNPIENAQQVRDTVIQKLDKSFKNSIPTVEDVQDAVEHVLIETGHSEMAKGFILYRKKRQELREAKSALGVNDDMKLSFRALHILATHRLLQRKSEDTLETPKEMFLRVAHALAKAEKKYNENAEKTEAEFALLFFNLELVPSTAILRHAGRGQNHLADAFVLPIDDDIVSLFDTLKQAALLHKNRQRGFGIGISFSPLRPKGAKVGQGGFGESAAGPVSFLQMYDRALHQINPYGTNGAFLSVHHPDIIDFITAKENVQLHNFGLSVVFTREFMRAVKEDGMYKLIDPHSKGIVAKLRARSVIDMITTIAWRTGDPAIVFLDNLNNGSPFSDIDATSPTGEQPLFPHEGCFSASINIEKHIKNKQIDWEKLQLTVASAVRLLDNAIDISVYPTAAMRHAIEYTRRIGIGMMGWADALIACEIPYNSPEALATGEKLMAFISKEAKNASMNLAKKRGTFGGFSESKNKEKVRNISRTTIVNSGITSVIAGCSQGIEPHYAIGYLKKTPSAEMFEVLPAFEEVAQREGFFTTELVKKSALAGSLRGVKEVPQKWRRLFVTAHDCSIQDHLAMQIAFQKYTDNGVSKTINLPPSSTINEIEEIIMRAYDAGCKSIHVYREGSTQQLMYAQKKQRRKK